MKQKSPYIPKYQPALVEGMAETPEEKRAMREQIQRAMNEAYPDDELWDGPFGLEIKVERRDRIKKLQPQPTPIRSEARPKAEEDRLRGFYPMLEEERQAQPEWRE